MRHRVLAGAGVVVLVAAGSFGAGHFTASTRQPEALGAMPPSMMLAPEHELLKRHVGSWEGSVKFDMGGGWVETTGTIRREMILDGRFVMEHIDSDFMGQPFKGIGIMGYNTSEKKFESFWIENAVTHMAFADGSYDAKTKTYTFEGDMLDPMSGETKRQRTVVDVSKSDVETMTGYTVHADGTKTKNFEGHFKRK